VRVEDSDSAIHNPSGVLADGPRRRAVDKQAPWRPPNGVGLHRVRAGRAGQGPTDLAQHLSCFGRRRSDMRGRSLLDGRTGVLIDPSGETSKDADIVVEVELFADVVIDKDRSSPADRSTSRTSSLTGIRPTSCSKRRTSRVS
jgi:hypothetical protein